MQATLAIYEWVIVLLFSAILILLIIVSVFRETTDQFPLQEKLLQATGVEVRGAVLNPGFYEMPESRSALELLEQAKLTERADLSQVKITKKLKGGQLLYIPERKEIHILIDGAVEQPGIVKILSGMRYRELVNEIKLLPEADVRVLLKKKGYVKADSSIYIPFKKKRLMQRKNEKYEQPK